MLLAWGYRFKINRRHLLCNSQKARYQAHQRVEMMRGIVWFCFLASCCSLAAGGHRSGDGEANARPCRVGNLTSLSFITEDELTEEVPCRGEDAICRQLTVSVVFREEFPKTYIAFGECIRKGDIEGERCDGEHYCSEVLVEVLTPRVEQNRTALATRCSSKCCYPDGGCDGMSTSPPRQFVRLVPESPANVASTTPQPTAQQSEDLLAGSSAASSSTAAGSFVSIGGREESSTAGEAAGDGSSSSASGSSSGVAGASSGGVSSGGSVMSESVRGKCHVGAMMTDDVGDQLTNVTQCASDEYCRSVAIALEFWGYETEKDRLVVGDCVSQAEEDSMCEGSDSMCDAMIARHVHHQLPAGADVTHSSCQVSCCSDGVCQGAASASGGPFFPERVLPPASYDASNIPLMPGCTLNEADRDLWLCTIIYFNDYPYDDEARCRRNAEDMGKCIERVGSLCLYGDKPTMWDALGIYKSSTANWEMYEKMTTVSPTDQFAAFCDRETIVTAEKLTLLTGQPGGESMDSMARDSLESIKKIYLAENGFAFCRLWDEFMVEMKTRVSEWVALNFDMADLGADSPPGLNYSYFSMNHLANTIGDKKLPRCMAVAQREDELSMYEYQMGYFMQPDENGCESYSLDVVVAVDGSKLVARDDFGKVLLLVRNLTERFDVKSNSFELLQFSGKSGKSAKSKKKTLRVEFGLGEMRSHLEISEALKDVRQLRKRRVFMERVLRKAESDLDASERSDDPCVKPVVIVVAAERFVDESATGTAARRLRDSGITLFAVGVGDSALWESVERDQVFDGFFTAPDVDSLEDARVRLIEHLFQLFSDGTGLFVSGA